MDEQEKGEAEEEVAVAEADFSNLVAGDIPNISKLINFAQEGNYIRGWQTIKKLPLCRKMLS